MQALRYVDLWPLFLLLLVIIRLRLLSSSQWVTLGEHGAETSWQRSLLGFCLDTAQAVIVAVLTISVIILFSSDSAYFGGLCSLCALSLGNSASSRGSLQVNILFIHPDERELPYLKALVLCTRHEHLLILVPHHGCDRGGVSL